MELKQELYKELFCKKAKVTGKALLVYLKKKDAELTLEDISGFDADFKSSLSIYIDFKNHILREQIDDGKYQSIVENTQTCSAANRLRKSAGLNVEDGVIFLHAS